MINFTIPRKSRFVATANIFSAAFGSPIVGEYNFATPENQNVVVLELKPNTVYLIERISLGGNIAEEVFLNSLKDIPTIFLSTLLTKCAVWEKPIQIVGYKKNEDISTFITNEKSGEKLLMSVNGALKQIPDMVGVASVKMAIQFNVFAMDQRDYSEIYTTDRI